MPSAPDKEFHFRRAAEHRQMADVTETVSLRLIHLELAAWHDELMALDAQESPPSRTPDSTISSVPARIKMWRK